MASYQKKLIKFVIDIQDLLLDKCKLFVHGVELLTKEDLRIHFSQYGNVNRVDLLPKRKFAFIWFSTPSEAELAYKAGIPMGNKRRHCIIGSSATTYVTVNFENKEAETQEKTKEVRKFSSF